MKKLILVLLVLLCASVSSAQFSTMYTSYGVATPVWLNIAKSTDAPYVKIRGFEVFNDSTGTAGDTLWVAFNADTTAGRLFPVLQGESLSCPSVYLSSIRVKSSATSVPYRARLH
jgi:hypothetical protein